MQTDDMTGKFMDPCSRLRELSCSNKDDSARSGPEVHAKWLLEHNNDEVRCRLGATQLAIGERLVVTKYNRDGGKALVGDWLTASS